VESVALTQGATPTRVLLTGATGFIGSHLARLLVEQGQEVLAIIRPGADRWRIADIQRRLSFVDSDLRDATDILNQVRSWQPDICIHLGWQGWFGKPEADRNIASLRMSLALLSRMTELSCRRFVTAGTCFEYDLSGQRLSETSTLGPHDLYGACKKSLFEVAEHYAKLVGVSVVSARIFYAYGPYENARRLVPSIVRALLRGDIAKVTPGEQVRDYLHVSDIASAIWTVAKSDVVGAVNVASGEPITIAQIARRIGQLLEKPDLIHLGALPYRADEPMHILGDATVLRERLAWVPRFNIDSGLAETIHWWRQRVDRE